MKRRRTLTLRAFHRNPGSRRGVALLLVLGCLVLLTALILALIISSQNNLKSSKLYANGSSVKTLADSTVSLAMAQIGQATSNGTQVAWASQPGMIRTYDNTGKPLTNYRLFSWDSPTVSGTYTASTDATQLASSAGTPWYNSPAVFVDLNQPVADASKTLHYPIIDGNPSDLGHAAGDLTTSNYTSPTGTQVSTYAINGVTPGIEGFWVNLPNTTTGPAVNTGTSTASNHTNNDIPMPVKWLYVLKDGTVVAPVAGSSGTTVNIPNANATDKAVVGRIAYWTDDETAKVNINTASEGVFWDTPRATSTYERTQLAKFQPAQNEFQRYPGHPATTCLSTVFGSFWPVTHSGATYTASQFMPYFTLTPKLNVGSVTQSTNLGSNAGTAAPVSGSGATQVGTGTLAMKTTDRLYNSVDELEFQSDLPNGLGSSLPGGTGSADTSSYARTATSNGANSVIAANSASTSSVAPNFLEKARFFLTASSRAPDVNLFNQPRIGIWPISSTTGTTTRTPTDSTIAFCGTIGGLPYYFQRQNSYSATNDLPATYTAGDTGLDRNRQLITYLQSMTGTATPGFGPGTFLTKYPSGDRDQILTEIFDYIRTQNLIDPNVTTPFSTAPSFGVNYLGANAYTTSCGKGQVVPILDTQGNGGKGTRGFGRFPTITEAALVLIVQGWNDNTNGSPSTSDPNYKGVLAAGPPATYWGYATGTSTLWNFQNQTFQLSTLAPGHVRVQAALIFSLFDPSQAYPYNNGCYQIQVSGLDNFTLNGTPMGFPAQAKALSNWPVMSSTNYAYNDPKWGGITDWRTMIVGMSPTIGATAPTAPATASTAGPNQKYYPFFSNSIDLPYTSPAAPAPVAFVGGNITVNMLIPTGTTWAAGTQVQSIKLNFPPISALPVPTYAGPMTDSLGAHDLGRWDVRFGFGTNPYSPQSAFIHGADVVRSVRYNTDPRLIAATSTLDASSASAPNASYFTSYVGTETTTAIHSLQASTGWPLYGCVWGQFVPGLTYSNPDGNPWTGGVGLGNSGSLNDFLGAGYCPTQGAYLYNYTSASTPPTVTTNLGDWDNGVGITPDGGYINKADEGDFQYYYTTAAASTVPYFDDWYSAQAVSNSGQTFFSPNRLMPSAVMFGSLSTGVERGLPWQTLLFNPNPAGGNAHPGFGVGSGTQGPNDVPPYASSPPDHLFLDFFTMPVVEPYPISEPLSTAGRVNMNYQIVPFTYIERATGVRAVIKPERITAIPDGNAGSYKSMGGTTPNYTAANFRLPINLDATLTYFDNFFNTTGDIFRSASQICNMPLVPSQDADGTAISSGTYVPTTFWSTHRPTGDNSRERPYADIYPRLTTKSNTFTIHYYVQTLKKTPVTQAGQWVEGTDQVTGEYRGSTTIERYVDPNATGMPDFASNPGTALDAFYKFRVVNERQFAP